MNGFENQKKKVKAIRQMRFTFNKSEGFSPLLFGCKGWF